mmetsp:Transcript_72653/g.170315  ORF Transcript_72653/g.170315 Transcript_72653/m.170315 type:complete len:326 (-) Transcript_72653:852-1829(-)
MCLAKLLAVAFFPHLVLLQVQSFHHICRQAILRGQHRSFALFQRVLHEKAIRLHWLAGGQPMRAAGGLALKRRIPHALNMHYPACFWQVQAHGPHPHGKQQHLRLRFSWDWHCLELPHDPLALVVGRVPLQDSRPHAELTLHESCEKLTCDCATKENEYLLSPRDYATQEVEQLYQLSTVVDVLVLSLAIEAFWHIHLAQHAAPTQCFLGQVLASPSLRIAPGMRAEQLEFTQAPMWGNLLSQGRFLENLVQRSLIRSHLQRNLHFFLCDQLNSLAAVPAQCDQLQQLPEACTPFLRVWKALPEVLQTSRAVRLDKLENGVDVIQ